MQHTHTPPKRLIALTAIALAAVLSTGCEIAPSEPDPNAVAEVVVGPDSVAGNVGAVIAFTAQPRNSAGEVLAGETITWTSLDPLIATVDGTGQVTLVAVGFTRIEAKAGQKKGHGKVTVTPATLTSLSLTPPTANLIGGTTQQFAVSGTWSNGTTTPPAATYTATGGTINSSGLYTAGNAAGTYRVIATHTGGTLADSATVTITAATLTSLTLTPPTATIATGATQQFAVAGTWSNGTNTPPAVTYSATGGTISAAGLYTAGVAAGSFRVIATHTGGTLADSSTVTITAPVAGLANECDSPQAGWIWCDDFDQNRLTSYFEFETAGGLFARVAAVGNDGSYGMRAHWNAGTVSAGALHLAIGRTPQSYFAPAGAGAGTTDYREIYWRVFVKNQAGWTGGGADKLSRAMIFASNSSWAQAMIAHVWSGDNAASLNMLMIDPARGTDALGNLVTTGYNDFAHLTWIGAVHGTNPLFSAANVGVWHCVEAHVRLNDAGSSNGLQEMWIDGVLDAQRTGLNWVGSYNAYGINAVFLENYWNAGSPASQDRFMDNFVVSTQRIGCGA